MLSFNPIIPSSFVTLDEYQRLSGMPKGTIRDKVSSGDIITKKKKGRNEKTMVNMVAMTEIAVREALEMLG